MATFIGASFVSQKQMDMAIAYWKRSFDSAEIELPTNNRIEIIGFLRRNKTLIQDIFTFKIFFIAYALDVWSRAIAFVPDFDETQKATHGNYKEARYHNWWFNLIAALNL